MRLVLIAVLLATGSSRAQTLVDPNRISTALSSFEPKPGEVVLKCHVSPIRPVLNFNFRFQSGYMVRVPMNQYTGARHFWTILTRITPVPGGEPVYMADRLRLPVIPKTKVEFEFGGMYLVGEGRYRAEWIMLDETGRVCRKQWSFQAKRNRDERRVSAAMPAGTIAELSLRGSRRAAPNPEDAAPFRLTVLLHVAPFSPRRTRMGVRDRVLLTSALAALLERLPAKSVRMVAFSLDQQKELFREENFVLRGLDRVSRAINETEMGTVDFQVLQNRRGHTEMMARLLNSELNDPNPSDVVVVLGPASRFFDKLPQGAVEKPASPSPQFFFFHYGPSFRVQATLTDTIGMAMSKVRGRKILIRTPGDFAKAIEMVEKSASAGN